MKEPAPFKTLYVFRHGETDWNACGRFQGHLDIPLDNDHGRRQSLELAERLRPHGLQAVLSSDLSRALETARIVAARLGGIPVVACRGLREAFLGEAQGLTYEEISARFGAEVLGRWRSDHPADANVSYPGGESGQQVMDRSFAAIERFFRPRQPGGLGGFERVGIACHGGVIRRMIQGIRPPGREAVKIPNTVLYVIRYEARGGHWTLIG